MNFGNFLLIFVLTILKCNLATDDVLPQAVASYIKQSHYAEVSIVKYIKDEKLGPLLIKHILTALEALNRLIAVRIYRSNIRNFKVEKISNAILLTDNIVWLEELNAEGKLLIVFLGKNNFNLTELFTALWKKMIYDVNVLQIDNTRSHVTMLTFTPFDGESCNDTTPKEVNRYNQTTIKWTNREFFPDKFKKLHGCPLNVGTYESPPALMIKSVDGRLSLYGFEGDLFTQIAEQLNFTMAVVVTEERSDIVKLYPNGSSFGINKMVMEGEVDFIMSLLSMTPLRSEFMSVTRPYYIDEMIAIIPPAKLMSPFRKLFSGFNIYVWMSLLAALTFILLVYEGVKFISPRFYYHFIIGTNIKTPYLNMFFGLLGGTLHKLPFASFARYLLALQLVFYFFVRNMYQGALFDVLNSNIQMNKISSLKDINRLRYPFYMNVGMENKVRNVSMIQK